MAKIMIEVDTSKKTGTVKVDGKKMDNISHVFYSTDNGFGDFAVEVVSREEGNDLRKITRLVADENGNLVSSDKEVGRLDMSQALQKRWSK